METTKEEGANLSDLFLVPEGSPLTTKSSLKLPVTRCRNWSLCSASSFPHTTRRRCWRGASTLYWRIQSLVNWRFSSSPMAAPIVLTEIARGYSMVGMIEVFEASKHAALNAGDAAATVFPRAYFGCGHHDRRRCPPSCGGRTGSHRRPGWSTTGRRSTSTDVQRSFGSFYRVWCELPWFTDNPIGSGNRRAVPPPATRAFATFPAITNDDQYVHDLFEPRERATANSHQFFVRPPRTVGGLIRRRTRTLTGQRRT